MNPAETKTEPVAASVDPVHTHVVAEYKHQRPLTTLACDPAGRLLAAGAEDLNVQLWDLQSDRQRTLEGHDSWVRSMRFSADGSQLYTACWGGVLKAWDLTADQPQVLYSVQAHQGSARWVGVSPDGRWLVTCGNDLLVKIWDAGDGSLRQVFAGHARHVYGAQFHPTAPLLVSQDLVGGVKLWNYLTGQPEHTFVADMMTGYDKKFAADMGGSRDLQFDPDGTAWASAGITKLTNGFAGDQDPLIVLFDWQTCKPLRRFHAAKNFKGIAWGVRFHRSGFVIGAGAHKNGKGALWFYNRQQDEPFHTVATPRAARGLDLIGEDRFAVAHADGTASVYQMTEPEAEPQTETQTETEG